MFVMFKRMYSSFMPVEKLIKVGRGKDSDVKISSTSVSKCQCLLYYMKKNWVIIDGDGKKPSSNGTWLFADEMFLIYDGMVIKAGQTILKVNIINSNSN